MAHRKTETIPPAGAPMELREIKALLVLMSEFGLTELEIDDKKRGKLRLVRAGASDSAPAVRPAASSSPAPPPRILQTSLARESTDASPALTANQRLVSSPMVGTFYRASAPDVQPFVEEGAGVRKGQTLCIIEAMKMMNEIEAEVAGRVIKVLCDNAQPVEYGQPLMILEVA